MWMSPSGVETGSHDRDGRCMGVESTTKLWTWRKSKNGVSSLRTLALRQEESSPESAPAGISFAEMYMPSTGPGKCLDVTTAFVMIRLPCADLSTTSSNRSATGERPEVQ